MIQVAPDSSTQTVIISTSKDGKKIVAALEYELPMSEQGRIAVCAVDSREYERLTQLEGTKQLLAMRSKA